MKKTEEEEITLQDILDVKISVSPEEELIAELLSADKIPYTDAGLADAVEKLDLVVSEVR